MTDNLKKIFVGIIIISGTFCSGFAYEQFDFKNENSKFYVAQLAFLMLSTGCMGSYLIYKYNKWISILGAVCSFGVFKTFLLGNAPKVNMFESAIIGLCAFIVYYFIRKNNFKKDFLKWFLIPAIANIVVVLIQAFDHYPLFFLRVDGISGLIGNEGMSAVYLALTLPLFFKYFKWGIIPCFLAIIMSNGSIGLIAGAFGGLVYSYHRHKGVFYLVFTLLIVFSLIFSNTGKFNSVKGEAKLRAAMIVGTMDGIMHNPVLGWGVGSFIPVFSQIPPEHSEFLGVRLNTENAIMNHPHNGFLSGWWKVGVAFPVLILIAFRDFGQKYKEELLATYCIVLIAAIISMGWFFTVPALFLLITAFAVHENEFTNLINGGCDVKKNGKS